MKVLRTSEMFQDGDAFYAKIPGNLWIRVSCNNNEVEIVPHPKGSRLIPYGKEGWSDPPTAVLGKLKVAFAVARAVRDDAKRKIRRRISPATQKGAL